MLPKARRIKRRDFNPVLSQGRRSYSTHFILNTIKTNKPELSRFSVSVSKKVSNKASTRNTYRRRAYSVLAKAVNKTAKGFLCYFSFKKTETPPTFSTIEQEVLGLLRGAGVLS